MRRKDKEITDKKTIEKILAAAAFIRLGFDSGGRAEITPVRLENIFDGGFHVDKKGVAGAVSFQTDICTGIKKGERICSYSAKYLSVYGRGSVKEGKLSVESISAKSSAMTEMEIKTAKRPPLFERGEVDIRTADNIRLGLSDGKEIYIVPVNHAAMNGAYYFHSAKEGRKINLLRKLRGIAAEAETPDKSDSDLIYYSCFEANASIITEAEEKTAAMTAIAEKFSGKRYEFTPEILKKIEIIKLEI